MCVSVETTPEADFWQPELGGPRAARPGSTRRRLGAGEKLDGLADPREQEADRRVMAAVEPSDGGAAGRLPEELGRRRRDHLVDLARHHEHALADQAMRVGQ